MAAPATASVIAELGPNMALQDMRTQAKARVEYAMAIETKYPNTAITDPADEAQVKKLLEEADLLEMRIADLEAKENRVGRMQDMIERFGRPVRPAQGRQGEDYDRELSPGQQFTKSLEYQTLLQTGRLNSPLNTHNISVAMKEGTSFLVKALLTGASASSGGAWVPNDLQGGALELRQREINVLDLIPRLQTSSDTIEYVREDTYTNAAAFVAEASGDAQTGTVGRKPESTLAFSTQTALVKTLAHWLPVTNRMLADAPAIRGYIDTRLLLGLILTLEAQIVSGDGTGENLTGILNSGITTVAKGSDNEVDAIFKARTMVRTGAKMAPNGVLMNPVDFQQVRLLRENAASATLGQYLMGPPSVTGPVTVFGMPVVETEAIAADRVLVGAFNMGCTLFDREQSAIRVGTVNDQFIRNIQTILAEQRAAFVVWRPAAFVSVSGY